MPRAPNYPQDRLESAVRQVRRGGNLTRVAKQCGIPRTSLYRAIRQGPRRTCGSDRLQRLSPALESQIVDWIRSRHDQGLTTTYTNLIEHAYSLLREQGDETPLGANWRQRFMQRHPEVKTLIKLEGRHGRSAEIAAQRMAAEGARRSAESAGTGAVDADFGDIPHVRYGSGDGGEYHALGTDLADRDQSASLSDSLASSQMPDGGLDDTMLSGDDPGGAGLYGVGNPDAGSRFGTPDFDPESSHAFADAAADSSGPASPHARAPSHDTSGSGDQPSRPPSSQPAELDRETDFGESATDFLASYFQLHLAPDEDEEEEFEADPELQDRRLVWARHFGTLLINLNHKIKDQQQVLRRLWVAAQDAPEQPEDPLGIVFPNRIISGQEINETIEKRKRELGIID